jgi:phospholipid-binding lipoprotein MlaA
MNDIRAIIVFTAVGLTGCASTHANNPADPLEPINRGIYQFNDVVDKTIAKPLARGYKAVMPTAGRIMVSNFFSNLDDVTVTANDFFQFKLVQGFSDGMRLLVNSTIGVFGLIDVASAGGLYKHNEDFGQTLGKWGVGNGPYLVLPVLGPSTVRDTAGLYVDGYTSPMYQMSDMQARNLAYLLRGISRRAELLDQEQVLKEAMIDPYVFYRDAYLLSRLSQVYDGNPPRPKYDEEESDDTFFPQSSPGPNTPPTITKEPPSSTKPQ